MSKLRAYVSVNFYIDTEADFEDDQHIQDTLNDLEDRLQAVFKGDMISELFATQFDVSERSDTVVEIFDWEFPESYDPLDDRDGGF